MKFLTSSSLIILSAVILSTFTPELSAKCRHRCHSRSSVGFSFNYDARPRVYEYNYVAAPAPVAVYPAPVAVAPAPVAVVQPQPYYAQPVYYPGARVYVQPRYSYWGY